MTPYYALLALGVLSVLGGLFVLVWHVIAIGCEEPLINQRRKAWWTK